MNSFKHVEAAIEYEIARQIGPASRAASAWCRRRACGTPTRAPRTPCAPRSRRTTIATSPSRICRRCVVDDDVDRARARRAARAADRAAPALHRRSACRPTTPRVLTAEQSDRRLLRGGRSPAAPTPSWPPTGSRPSCSARLNRDGKTIDAIAGGAGALAELIAPHRRQDDQRQDRQGRLRQDVGDGQRRRARSSQAEGLHAGHRRRRASKPPAARRSTPTRSRSRRLPRRQRQDDRLLRRPGDEGDAGQGQPRAGQRDPEEAARHEHRRHRPRRDAVAAALRSRDGVLVAARSAPPARATRSGSPAAPSTRWRARSRTWWCAARRRSAAPPPTAWPSARAPARRSTTAAALLRATRPTAVNLFWALERMLKPLSQHDAVAPA